MVSAVFFFTHSVPLDLGISFFKQSMKRNKRTRQAYHKGSRFIIAFCDLTWTPKCFLHKIQTDWSYSIYLLRKPRDSGYEMFFQIPQIYFRRATVDHKASLSKKKNMSHIMILLNISVLQLQTHNLVSIASTKTYISVVWSMFYYRQQKTKQEVNFIFMMQSVINQRHLDANRLIDPLEWGDQSLDFLICRWGKSWSWPPHSKPI